MTDQAPDELQRESPPGSPDDERRTDRRVERFTVALCVVVLVINVSFRFLWLDRLPGINGDEAWYGVQVQDFLHGRDWSAQTPSKLPINPLLFLTESLLLSALPPSFWVLRLPIAVWACVALGMTYYLHRLVFRDRVEALLAATVTASLPMCLTYSRLCWDSSFTLVTAPLVIYPLIRILDGAWNRRFVLWFVLGAVLTVWNHVTHAVLILAALLVVVWEIRHRVWAWARRRPLSSFAFVFVGVGVALVVIKRSREAKLLWHSAESVFERLFAHLDAIGDIVFGPRVFDYLAGVPEPLWTRWLYPVALVLVLLTVVQIMHRGDRGDKVLAMLFVLTVVLVLSVGRRLDLDAQSHERYFVFLVPLAGTCLVRGVRIWFSQPTFIARIAMPAGCLGVCLIFHVQLWVNYFAPLRSQAYADRLHKTFWTGQREPKAELTKAILEQSRMHGPGVVFVENWWIRHPVRFLIGEVYIVREITDPLEVTGVAYAAGFADSAFVKRIRAEGQRHGLHLDEMPVGGTGVNPTLVLFVLESRTEIDDAERFP